MWTKYRLGLHNIKECEVPKLSIHYEIYTIIYIAINYIYNNLYIIHPMTPKINVPVPQDPY